MKSNIHVLQSHRGIFMRLWIFTNVFEESRWKFVFSICCMLQSLLWTFLCASFAHFSKRKKKKRIKLRSPIVTQLTLVHYDRYTWIIAQVLLVFSPLSDTKVRLRCRCSHISRDSIKFTYVFWKILHRQHGHGRAIKSVRVLNELRKYTFCSVLSKPFLPVVYDLPSKFIHIYWLHLFARA